MYAWDQAKGALAAQPCDPLISKMPGLPSGGGGLYSTAADYLRFAQMMLNGGERDGKRLIERRSVDMMRTNTLNEQTLDSKSGIGPVHLQPPTVVETSMVFAGRRRTAAVGEVEALLHELGVTIVPFGEPEWHASVAAFLRFGRRRHAAALNFGDCLAYGAAAAAHDSLLFVGDHFRQTDIPPA